jgi:O-antigen ligase
MIDTRDEMAYSVAVPWVLRIAFIVLIFSVPFETVKTPYTTLTFSISKFAGYVFFCVAAFYPKNSFRHLSYIVWLFLAYLLIYTLDGLYQNAELMPAIFDRAVTILQMIIFLWVAQNLLADPETARLVLFALGCSTTLMAVLQLLGITSTSQPGAPTRISAMAEDPNSAAAFASLGFLALLGLAYFSSYRSKLLKLAVVLPLAVILWSVVQTGSRTGLIGLVIGILIFSISKQEKGSYFKNIAVVSLTVALIAVVTVSDAYLMNRFEQSYYRGNLAQREKIFPAAMAMVEEKPWFGWGPVTNTTELGSRMRLPTRDPHNLFLQVLTEVGIIGSLPYFIAFFACALRAWNARSRLENVIPLALMACLFVVNNGITWHNRKLHWYVLAYCIASFPYAESYKKYFHPSPSKLYALN